MKRARRSCILAAIGFGVQLAISVGHPVLFYVVLGAMRNGLYPSGYARIMTAMSVVFAVFHAAAMGLIVAAIFTGRAQSPVSSAVPQSMTQQ